MQVGACRAACGPHGANDLPFFHAIADGNRVVLVVGIARRVTAAMIDFHKVAVSITVAGPGDDTGRDSLDRGALTTREISPSWRAILPENGSLRLPKYEEIQPDDTGQPSGWTCSCR